MTPELKVQRSVVSRTQFPNRSNLQEIRERMRHVRATGRLIVDFGQGGVNTITFEATHNLNGHDNVELLFQLPVPAPDSE